MPHTRQTAPSLRVMSCPVTGEAVIVDGLTYGHARGPRALRDLARSGRVAVIVDLDDIEILLVRDPRDGTLHRLECLTPRAARMQQLAWFLDAGPTTRDAEMTSPRLRSAA